LSLTFDLDLDLVSNVDLNGDVDVEPIVDLARRPPGQFRESRRGVTPKWSRSRATSESTSTSPSTSKSWVDVDVKVDDVGRGCSAGHYSTPLD